MICTWVICGLGVATGMICMCHCGWAWPLDDMYVSLWFGCGHWDIRIDCRYGLGVATGMICICATVVRAWPLGDTVCVSLWFGHGCWDIRIGCRYGLGMVII